MSQLILASQSPRRRQLLEWADIDFTVMVSNVEEDFPEGLDDEGVAIHIAKNKAADIKERLSKDDKRKILAADTIVVLDGEIINKPSDRDDAIRILSSLSGRTHNVITGVCILGPESEQIFSSRTEVEFHELSQEQIIYYVDKYKPYDKAGAYAIQEWIGVVGIKNIKGDFYNVMGLPVSLVVKALKS